MAVKPGRHRPADSCINISGAWLLILRIPIPWSCQEPLGLIRLTSEKHSRNLSSTVALLILPGTLSRTDCPNRKVPEYIAWRPTRMSQEPSMLSQDVVCIILKTLVSHGNDLALISPTAIAGSVSIV